MNNPEERSVEELDEIQRLIVEKDPDDNDKFLRQLWDLVAQAKETFHHQLQKARAEWLRTEIEKFVLPAPPDVLIPGESPIEHALREGKYHALISIITRYKEELKVLEGK